MLSLRGSRTLHRSAGEADVAIPNLELPHSLRLPRRRGAPSSSQ